MRRSPRPDTNAVDGIVVGLVGTGLVVAVLLPLRQHVGSAAPALLFTLAVGASALVGGARAAVVVSAAATAALDLAFVPPFGQLSVLSLEDVVALGALLVVGGTVGLLVAREGDRRREAEGREADLRALTQRLEELHRGNLELSQRASQADELRRLDDQRSALLRSVSHDLRTPLSAIRAVVTDLRSGVELDDPTRAELLTLVSDEVDRLDRLVANLLSLSRIEANAVVLERQAVDLEELVTDQLRRLAPLFADLRTRVSIPVDLPLVDADYSQLEQVFMNLLANAARHAPPDTDVWVVMAKDGADQVRVEVSDRGLGVAGDEATRIFEAFQRGTGSRSTGIGLAICRAIVEAHGGEIWVERTFGGGATFVFTLPVHRGTAPE
jgi:two-component system, OmpR family, sensor histidine kinase KdpD